MENVCTSYKGNEIQVICRFAILYNPAQVWVDHFEMSTLGHQMAVVRASRWRRVVILVAVLSLTLSVATRYTSSFASTYGQGISVSAVSAKVKTQHLLADGLQWIAPVAAILMLVVPRRTAGIVHLPLPVTNLCSEHWLYNRPPPVC